MIENVKAKEGLKEIFSKFEDVDLFALAATVTQGLLKKKLNNREGLFDSIQIYY